MIDLSKILDQDPVDNNVRRMRWQWAWRDHFGYFPRNNAGLYRRCRICKKAVFVKSLDDMLTRDFDYTCSTKCADMLDELNRENHWS